MNTSGDEEADNHNGHNDLEDERDSSTNELLLLDEANNDQERGEFEDENDDNDDDDDEDGSATEELAHSPSELSSSPPGSVASTFSPNQSLHLNTSL